jgi:hypothetical protein
MKATLIALIIGAQLCANAQRTATAPSTTPRPVEPYEAALERQAAHVARQAADAERQVNLVAKQVAGMTSYRDGVPPVQVRFSPADSKAAQEMDEDLAVMGLLIDQAIDEPQSAMGIDMVFTSGSRSVRGMYIEGAGTLYMIKVGFPLLGPEKAEEKAEEKPADSEWDKARQTLRGQKPSIEWESGSRSSTQFDPKQVDALKKVLLNTMKNGANFRHLKPDEHLSFAVFGRPSPVRASVHKNGFSQDAPSNKRGGSNYAITWSSSSGSDPGTVMTFKARKADIDAFAKGEMDYDAFAGKVITTAYAGSGYGITSINSWLQSGSGGGVGLQVR